MAYTSITLTAGHWSILKKEAQKCLQQQMEGQDYQEIAARYYAENMRGKKSLAQGRIMAEHLEETLAGFQQAVQYSGNKQNAAEIFLQKITECKEPVECCRIYTEIIAAVTEAERQMEKGELLEESDAQELLKKAEDKEITEQEATQELQDDLKEQAVEAIQNSSIIYNSLLGQTDFLEKAKENGITQMLLTMGRDEMAYECILIMIAYVKIKNGEFQGLPADLTIDEVAVGVAASIQQAKIMKKFGLGCITEEIAVNMLKFLAIVVVIALAKAALAAGVHIAVSLFGMILAVPAMMLIGYGILTASQKAYETLSQGAEVIAEGAAEAVSVTVMTMKAASKKIAEFMQEKAVPAAKQTMDRLRRGIEDFLENAGSKVQSLKRKVMVSS